MNRAQQNDVFPPHSLFGYSNTVQAVKNLLEKAGTDPAEVSAIGISNQRETTVAWDKRSGKPVCDAIVWQCSRADSVCKDFADEEKILIHESTGIPMSPYFPAAKMKWIMENIPKARQLAEKNCLCMGTVDSYLLYRMTKGLSFATDYSNASRTQLLNLHTLVWDESLCKRFGIPITCLPKVCYSDCHFGDTTLNGAFPHPVPIPHF